MTYTYTGPLSDETLLKHLEAGDHVIFKGPGVRWQEIERQVEQLGLGERFLVSSTKGKQGESCRLGPHQHVQ